MRCSFSPYACELAQRQIHGCWFSHASIQNLVLALGGPQFHRRKRRKEIAALLEALVAKHPTGTVYVSWDNADTHEDDEVEDVVRAAAGRLVLLYLPTYSPWLNPI